MRRMENTKRAVHVPVPNRTESIAIEPATAPKMPEPTERRECVISMDICSLRVVSKGTISEYYPSADADLQIWDRTDYDIFITPKGVAQEHGMGHIVLLRATVATEHPPVVPHLPLHEGETDSQMASILAERGIKGCEKAVRINIFWPFGPGDDVYKRKGIGRALLRKVIDDCIAEGAAVVVGCTINEEMIALLKDKEFNFEEADPYFYFKILKPSTS
jgi:hypothetical protein